MPNRLINEFAIHVYDREFLYLISLDQNDERKKMWIF